MDRARNLRVSLRVVFYVEGESWVAHCLEFDLVGDGSTKEEALEALSVAIAIQVNASLEFNNPANLFTPADGEFFQKYAEGVDVADGELTVRMNRLRSSTPIIEAVEAREYTYRGGRDLVMA
jgi:predicted RNase H-like HicB family nuclease